MNTEQALEDHGPGCDGPLNCTCPPADVLADRYGIEFGAVEVADNPNMADMPAGSTHWQVTLTARADEADILDVDCSMTLVFSMGPACSTPPTLYDVLACVVSDCAMWDSGDLDTFEDYCATFGYDTDSRKAHAEWERVRAAIMQQAGDLRRVLGENAYTALLEDEAAR